MSVREPPRALCESRRQRTSIQRPLRDHLTPPPATYRLVDAPRCQADSRWHRTPQVTRILRAGAPHVPAGARLRAAQRRGRPPRHHRAPAVRPGDGGGGLREGGRREPVLPRRGVDAGHLARSGSAGAHRRCSRSAITEASVPPRAACLLFFVPLLCLSWWAVYLPAVLPAEPASNGGHFCSERRSSALRKPNRATCKTLGVAARLSPPILRGEHPLFWISTVCSGPEGPAASQETETKGIDVFSTERRDTGG